MSSKNHNDSFAEAFRNSISQAGVTLTWISQRMGDLHHPVSISTLSYWQSGQRNPSGPRSLRIIEHLERILNVPPGYLLARVERSVYLGGLRPSESPLPDHQARSIDALYKKLGVPGSDAVRGISTHSFVAVNSQGIMRSISTELLLQSINSTIEEVGYFFTSDDFPPDFGLSGLNIAGGTPVRFAHSGDRTILGVAIALDAPLERGATGWLKLTGVLPASFIANKTIDEYGVAVDRRSREVLVVVELDIENEGSWVEGKAETVNSDTLIPWSDLTIHGRRAHIARHDFGPGVVAVRWGGFNGV